MIIVDDKKLRTVPEQVSKNMEDIEDLKGRDYVYKNDVINNLTSYQTKKPLSANQGRILKDMLNTAIAGVFKYKGSVATFSDLPSSGMVVGDTYNVLDTGDNYTWDGTGWDKLSGIVDLSSYYTKTESDNKFIDKTTNQDISGLKVIRSSGFGFANSLGGPIGSYLKANTNNGLSIYSASMTEIINFSGSGIISMGSGNLGSSNDRWGHLYIAGVVNPNNNVYGLVFPNTSGFTANKTIATLDDIPSTTDFVDLTSNQVITGIKTLPIGTKIKISDSYYYEFTDDGFGQLGIKRAGQYGITLDGNTVRNVAGINPDSNNSADLGTSSLKFKDIYLGGAVKADSYQNTSGSLYIQFRSNDINVTKDLIANSGTNSLGTASYAWKDLYLSGELKSGANTATIADIAALIAYAKAQGWIS